ncbi:MAG: phosphoglycerate-specific signal transduction histidine kinase [Parasphingorhabdus sp.]|jgi:phosphoglycerate-specific signal transduction histidine kinase
MSIMGSGLSTEHSFEEHAKKLQLQASIKNLPADCLNIITLTQIEQVTPRRVDPKTMLLGNLAHHVVHQINQPLSVIRMAVGTAKHKLERGDYDESYLKDRLDRIDSNCCKTSEIAETMRLFVPRESDETEPTEVAQIIATATTVSRPAFRRENIELIPEEPLVGKIDSLEFHIESIIVYLLGLMKARYRGNEIAHPRRVQISSSISTGNPVNIVLEDFAGSAGQDSLMAPEPAFAETIFGANFEYCQIAMDQSGGIMTINPTRDGMCIYLSFAQLVD